MAALALLAAVADWLEGHIFWVALVSFGIVFLPAWLPLLRPPPKAPPPFLDPEDWKQMPLVAKKSVSHNTRLFRFALSQRDQLLGLPIGQHISLKAPDVSPMLLRPYTPTSDNEQRGVVDFVIKVYPEGRFSQHLDKMRLGDCILAKGPKGRFQYTRNMRRHIGMIAGGTGVTPMYQVINHIMRDPAEATQVSLIFANVTEDDILLRKELDFLPRLHTNFKVHYVLNKPPKVWDGSTGFVTADIIRQHLPPAHEDVLVLRCGPLPMNEAVKKCLDNLGYSEEQQFQF